jgi:cardiolipin synthase
LNVDITPVASGDAWIGYGVRSFRSVINELIANAKSELVMTVYVLTNREIVEDIKGALGRGVAVSIYLYQDDKRIPETDAVNCIFQLKKEFPYLTISPVNNKVLHAKIIVADGKKVLVGSANLTVSAMVSNYELGFLVDDARVAGKVIELIQKMRE